MAIIGCDVDAEQFEKDCLATLFPNMWNTWQLLFTNENQTNAELERQVKAALVVYTSKYGGKIRHVSIALRQNPWSEPTYEKRGDCVHPITLQGASAISVWVRFVYRGAQQSLPWLVLKKIGPDSLQGTYTPQIVCPQEAHSILERVYTPSQINVPDESEDSVFAPPIGDLGDILNAKVIIPAGDFLSSLKPVLIIGGIIVGVGVLGYGIRSVR